MLCSCRPTTPTVDPKTMNCTDVPDDQCHAWQDLVDATGGAAWRTPANRSSPCSQRGGLFPLFPYVTCSGGYPAGQLRNITKILLADNRLAGTIPETIGKLTSLRMLDLGDNNGLEGSIPPSLFTIPALTSLRLANNNLGGAIPATLARATGMTSLNLAINSPGLSGSVPNALGNLTALVTLSLGNNLLHGTLPASLGRCTALNFLSVGGTAAAGVGLTGTIPDELAKLTLLGELDLSANGLTGSIPLAFGNLTKLNVLRLQNNAFNGTLPPFNFARMGGAPNCNVGGEDTAFSCPLPEGASSCQLPSNPIRTVPPLCQTPTPAPPPPTPGPGTGLGWAARDSIIFVFLSLLVLVGVVWRRNLLQRRQRRPPLQRGRLYALSEKLLGAGRGCSSDGSSSSGAGRRRGMENFTQLARVAGEDLVISMEALDFRADDVIGQGSFGRVYRALHVDTGEVVALKELCFAAESAEERQALLQSVTKEATVLAKLQHANIVRLIGVASSHHYCYIVTELCASSLDQAEARQGGFRTDPARWLAVAKQIASAISYLHANGVIHRDLKEANVLLDSDGVCKVCDFGVSALYDERDQDRGVATFTRGQGTPIYMAPEVMVGGESVTRYSNAVDVYSFAIMLLRMWTAVRPYTELACTSMIELLHAIARGERPQLPSDLPPFARNLIVRCWDPAPGRRPTFAQIVTILEQAPPAAFGVAEQTVAMFNSVGL